MKLENLLQIREKVNEKTAFMGFDGFLDIVSHLSHGSKDVFQEMSTFGQFLIDRNEKSCALELQGRISKLGGNMPICANALAAFGIPVTCVGSLGDEKVEEAFLEMNPLCTLHPVAAPGRCLALEFEDNKLMLADMSGPAGMTWEGILNTLGHEKFIRMLEKASLIGMFNWGEIPNIKEVWAGVAEDILPKLSGKQRSTLFDLSDCSGCDSESILEILKVIASYKKYTKVVLSCNDNELIAMAKALGENGQDIVKMGEAVYQSGVVDVLVHHSLEYARVFDEDGISTVDNIHVENPVIVTGGGDHFNAGYALGMIAGLSGSDCALLGVTVSRLYVANGTSPDISVLLEDEALRKACD